MFKLTNVRAEFIQIDYFLHLSYSTLYESVIWNESKLQRNVAVSIFFAANSN